MSRETDKTPPHDKILAVIGSIFCYYFQDCSAAAICGLNFPDIEVGNVPIDPNAPDLSDAMSEAERIGKKWTNRSTKSCARSDNYWRGERPVPRLRIYHIKRG